MVPRDIFYNIGSLELDQIKELLKEAYVMCDKWSVDELNCSKSWSRQKINMSFEEVMKKANDDTFYIFIHRFNLMMYGNSAYDGEDKDIMGRRRQYLEIGFRTMTSIDYFLWIHVPVKKKEYFLDKYNLEKKN